MCRRCRWWLQAQPAYVRLSFLPLNSPEVGLRFPGLERLHPEREIVVISDAGEVWQGGSAWIMCLWALREYREWAQRLAHPALLPLARRTCTLISENRHRLSRWLAKAGSDAELRLKLEALHEGEPDEYEGYCKTRSPR